VLATVDHLVKLISILEELSVYTLQIGDELGVAREPTLNVPWTHGL
jgi:hypothetical protein